MRYLTNKNKNRTRNEIFYKYQKQNINKWVILQIIIIKQWEKRYLTNNMNKTMRNAIFHE